MGFNGIYIYIYTYLLLGGNHTSYLGKFDHDLTVLPNPGIMVNKGNHSQMCRKIQVGELL